VGDSGSASVVLAAERNLRKTVEGALTTHPEFFDVVGGTSEAGRVVALVVAEAPDVAVIDLEMNGIGGVRAVRDLRSQAPATALVVIAGARAEFTAAEAMRAGASVHLTRRDTRSPARVRAAVWVAGDGGRMVAREGVPSLISAIGRSAPQEIALPARRQLTPREREVLTLMADGGTNRQIAARLEISEQSVKNHISNLLRKLGARNRTEAAAVARRDGLIA
jgi:DNA-binding NarL/FixJ family response regulator